MIGSAFVAQSLARSGVKQSGKQFARQPAGC